MEQKDEERQAGQGWIDDGRLAYRPKELAELVGLSAKSIYRAIERGELKAARVSNGTRLLVLASSARSWLEENLVEPQVPQLPASEGPRRTRPRRGELRPLSTVFRELDLARTSGYDRKGT